MIGRVKERQLLREFSETTESEFLTVTRRRRVGKTFLVRHTYAESMVFEMMGIQNVTV